MQQTVRQRLVFRPANPSETTRLAVQREARHCSLTGYIRELHEGRFEIVAEGAHDVLMMFMYSLGPVTDTRDVSISKIEWKPATGEYQDFALA